MVAVIVNILLFLLVIGVLTFIHELGHFTVAKLVGATVYEFALGWGPKLFSKKYKGTEYSIRMLPIGGFVKILGDGDPGKEGEEKDLKKDPGNLNNKSKFAQVLVMLAGVFMNVVFAISAYYIVLSSLNWTVPLDSSFQDFQPIGGEMIKEKISDVEYSNVVDDMGAQLAGLPIEGVISSIDGNRVEYSDQVSEFLKEKSGGESVVNVCAESRCDDYTVEVSEDGKIGVMLKNNYLVAISYQENKIFAGFAHVLNTLNLVSQRFGEMFSAAKDSGDYSELSNTVSGPVGIYFLIDYFKNFGAITFLSIVADLSLSLAIMNILPIPALDGGRILILLIEGVLGKDLNEKIEALIINISFILIMLLVVVIMVKDILNIDTLRSMFG
jgi:regulator of sigma E protease